MSALTGGFWAPWTEQLAEGGAGFLAVEGLDTLSSHPRATKILAPLHVFPCRTSERGSVERKAERAWGFRFWLPLVCLRGLVQAVAAGVGGGGAGVGLELGGFPWA